MSITRASALGAGFVLFFAATAFAQAPKNVAESQSAESKQAVAQSTCDEVPREDGLVPLCAPVAIEANSFAATIPVPIRLVVPAGTAMRIAIDERVRIWQPGQPVRGKLVDTIYAFDSAVIPAGSVLTGRVANIAPVTAIRRTMAYSNGDFSPFHRYEVAFDRVTLPNGQVLAIKTTVSPGTAEVVRLVSKPENEAEKGAAGRAADKTKEEAKGKIQDAKNQAHDTWQEIRAPGRLHRLKEYLVAQSPYRHQYLQAGTRFVADLDAPLDFGGEMRTGEQLALLGSEPVPDTTLRARLVAEVSSATARKGTPVSAVLTEPVYSPDHQLILPANSRLIGEVTQARAARKLHHNGELRLNFVRVEQPEEASAALAQLQTQEAQAKSQANSQAMIGNVEGLEVDRRSNMKLDEEGGARTTDNKGRYLSTGLAVLLAAAASHTEVERGQVETADPTVRTAAGGSGSGFRLTGALISLAAKSMPVSVALGAYGASSSIYANFLKRGRDVVLPKDTPMEIGFGPPHQKAQNSQTTDAPR